MTEYGTPDEKIEKLFIEVKESKNIREWVDFQLLTNNKQKKAYDIIKLNDLVGALTQGINFAVIINESIFEQLPEELQYIAFDECLTGVCISDTDAVSLQKADFATFTGVLAKYGHENVIKLKESIISLYDTQREEALKEKEQTKSLKAENSAKKKNFKHK